MTNYDDEDDDERTNLHSTINIPYHIPYCISERTVATAACWLKSPKVNRRDYSCRYPDNRLYSTFRLHESMISDRFVVPEIEIANPPDAI